MPGKRIALQRIKLTKETIERMTPPAEGRRYVYDVRIRGLGLCITSTGRRTWYLYRKISGKPERFKIGEFPAFTVQQAIDVAEQLRGRVAGGENPAEERRRRKHVPTLKELFDEFIAAPSRTRDKRTRAERTTAEYRQQFDKYLTAWHDRKINTITKAEVNELHDKLTTDSGPYTANRVLALLKAMFATALDNERLTFNPATRVRKCAEKKRKRRLEANEIPAFFAALKGEPNETLRDFFTLCLYTGARRSNVQAMAWVELDLDAAVWNIPFTKNGEAQRVHLPAPAIAVLKRRKAKAAEGYPWVFPGGKKNRAGHLKSPKVAWKRLIDRGGFTDLRIHDLRRTLGSFQADQGSSLNIIGASLGHKSLEATAIYARTATAPVDQSVDAAVAAIVAASKPKRSNRKTG